MEIVLIIFLYFLFVNYCLTRLIIPKVISTCIKYGIRESPQKRKEHKKPMITLGGIGLFLSSQISILTFLIINGNLNILDIDNFLILKIQLFSLFIYIVGILDDIIDLSAYPRLIIQFFIAFLTWFSGIKIQIINLTLTENLTYKFNLPILISCVFTLIWIVGIINAINWVDGLDGLASSLVITSSLGFIILSLFNNQTSALILSFALLGSCLSFLKYNYYFCTL